MKRTAETAGENGWIPQGRCASLRRIATWKARDRRSLQPQIIIISKEGLYGDILRRAKADPKFTNLGDNVSNIRQSQKQKLMLELKKSKDITRTNS